MIISIIIYVILSAILMILYARLIDEPLNTNKILQCVFFGWLAVIIIILYTILAVSKFVIKWILDKLV